MPTGVGTPTHGHRGTWRAHDGEQVERDDIRGRTEAADIESDERSAQEDAREVTRHGDLRAGCEVVGIVKVKGIDVGVHAIG